MVGVLITIGKVVGIIALTLVGLRLREATYSSARGWDASSWWDERKEARRRRKALQDEARRAASQEDKTRSEK